MVLGHNPRNLGWKLGLALSLAALLAGGCDAKCQQQPPLEEVQADTIERLQERLDAIDASDAKRDAVSELVKSTMPALMRVREETRPRQREILAELKRPEPDRARVAALMDKNIDAGNAYLHEMINVLMAGHALFTPAERKQLAEDAKKPSERFEGSWVFDRAVDYFMVRIEANAGQRELVEKMKADLLVRGRALQKEVDALRAEAATEWAREAPDVRKIHATLDRGRDLTRAALYDLAGYYLLLASKLDARQRRLLHAEMVRFEPCPVAAAAGASPGRT